MRFRLLALVCLLCCVAISPAGATSAPTLPQAHSAVLMECTTGEIIFDKYGSKRMPPASTTKILTALIAIESGRLDEPVTVSPHAAKTEGSRMKLSAEQVLTLRELVTGLLLRSGNDAAVAIAEHLAGTTDEFARMMNARAYALGITDSHFVNPHGLPAEGHYVTARDLARIARCAMQNDTFAQLVASRTAEIDWQDDGITHHQSLRNTNKLLWTLASADGIKTGTTGEAGACLVASASENGHRYIAVLLNDPARFTDAYRLLRWGFDAYVLLTGGKAGEEMGKAPIIGGREDYVRGILVDNLYALVKKETAEATWALTVWNEPIASPVYRGQTIGTRYYYADGTLLSSVDIIAAEDVPRASYLFTLLQFYTACLKELATQGLL